MEPLKPFVIIVKSTLPFMLDFNDVIYIEREHNELLCSKISTLSSHNNFIFLPKIVDKMQTNGTIDYYNPSGNKVSYDHIYNIFLDYMVDASEITHGLLNYTGKENKDGYICSFVNLDSDFNLNLMDGIINHLMSFRSDYCKAYKSHSILYKIDYSADEDFHLDKRNSRNEAIERENLILIRELKSRIRKLEKNGMSLELIYNILGREKETVEKAELSKIIVDERSRIYLSDFDNIEVKMTPLVKTVYLFFLKHSEGILLKDMPDYYDEMLSIYNHITAFSDSNSIRKAIERLCNPTDNSINEKCSRIRLIFKSLFDEEIANYYCVSGGRGERKYIKLDKSMISFNNNIRTND